MPGTVEELETESLCTIEMAGLFNGENRPDFLPADVHVQRFRLDIEELAGCAEISELAGCLQGNSAIGNDDLGDRSHGRCRTPQEFGSTLPIGSGLAQWPDRLGRPG